MAEIVNLNRRRKAKARADKDQQAEANRVAFGRTKAEKLAERQRAERQRTALDGKKLEDHSQ